MRESVSGTTSKASVPVVAVDDGQADAVDGDGVADRGAVSHTTTSRPSSNDTTVPTSLTSPVNTHEP